MSCKHTPKRVEQEQTRVTEGLRFASRVSIFMGSQQSSRREERVVLPRFLVAHLVSTFVHVVVFLRPGATHPTKHHPNCVFCSPLPKMNSPPRKKGKGKKNNNNLNRPTHTHQNRERNNDANNSEVSHICDFKLGISLCGCPNPERRTRVQAVVWGRALVLDRLGTLVIQKSSYKLQSSQRRARA